MLPEAAYRDLFAYQFKGVRETPLSFGRADVTFSEGMVDRIFVVEVEPYATWRHGVRQALAYSAMTGKRNVVGGWSRTPTYAPALATYGQITREMAQDLYDKTRGTLALFLLEEMTWRQITDRPRRKHVPADDAAIKTELARIQSELRRRVVPFKRSA